MCEFLHTVRMKGNPIIRPEMLPGRDGENINGPSLIRVPDWIDRPLGKYYLYFAHHVGAYIRLAYANDLGGPWMVHVPGALRLENTVCNFIESPGWADYKHIASPDVHVDDTSQEIRMYFHGPAHVSGPRTENNSYQQMSMVAISKDGMHFSAQSELLGNSYFRIFNWDGFTYALGMPGIFYRSKDGMHNFVEGPTLFNENMRHSAVRVANNRLQVFYTMVGERPERIVFSEIELERPWMEWKVSDPVVILMPEMDWEGADLPLQPSVRGAAHSRLRELRDPALFEEAGNKYLLYSVAGESGIAIAQIYLD